MPDVVKHGWTHRPRSEGGTDPIAIDSGMKWAVASASPMTSSDVTNTYRLTFDGLYSNDATAFEPATVVAGRAHWVQLNEPGYYVAKFAIYNAAAFASPGAGFVEPLFESGSPAWIQANQGVADFSGILFSAISDVRSGQGDLWAGMYTELTFNWNPDAPVSDLDVENPLNIGLAWVQVGAAATLDLGGQVFLMRISGPGYTDLSP